MRSIDNLREYALTAASVNATTRAVLAGYIDGIERDVAELTDERDLLKLKWEAGVDFDQRLEACADKREDVTLWGVDYTPLPVDADGVPIHVGDVMENIVCPSVHREVTGVGVECFYGWDEGNGRYSQFDVVCYRHHHAPTVEDLIRDAILSCIGHSPEYWDEPIAECAAKLGRGECHEIMIDRFFRWCGECGYMWEYMYSIGKRVRPNFCPNYGAKVVSDG